MHRRLARLVAQTNAAKDHRPSEDQGRRFSVGIDIGLNGLVFDAAKNGSGSVNNSPVFGNTNFQTAADDVHIDHSLVDSHTCFPKVEFDASEHRDRVATAKVRCIDAPLAAAKDRKGTATGGSSGCRAPSSNGGGIKISLAVHA